MKTKNLFGDRPKFLYVGLSLPLMILYPNVQNAWADVVEASTTSSNASAAILVVGIAVTVAGLGLLAFGIGIPRLFRTWRKTDHRNPPDLADTAGSRVGPG